VKSKPVATDFDQVVNEAKRGHITDNLKKDGNKTIHDLEVKQGKAQTLKSGSSPIDEERRQKC